MIICAGNIESFDFATPIGIGLIESSINLTQLVLKNKPKSLLFVGTAGSYGEYKPLDLIHSNSSTNIETGYFSGSCYTPISNKVTSKTFNVSCETANNNKIIINSSNYITTNKQVSEHFLNIGIEAENMEFFSVLTVAKKFKIPAVGIFAITNFCDKNAHQDFIKNHKKAKEILTKKTKEIMETYE
ncbi:MAG: purine-nucleoside phosphorylase [Sulfurospirillaceae bacterium]|nr:purine-nucleoside phosphorylase [Sulfurospirillaceae bacterium]